jgi:hypothetical protein
VAGVCQGSCAPGQVNCSGLTPQTCSTSGQWLNGTTCPYVCLNGACTGMCKPGVTSCNGNTMQTCDSGGVFQSTETCPYVCSNGACTGVCTPGSTQCCAQNGTTTTCGPTETGMWQQSSNYSVFTQTCSSSGQWTNGVTCGSCATETIVFGVHTCTTCNGQATCQVAYTPSGGTTVCACP